MQMSAGISGSHRSEPSHAYAWCKCTIFDQCLSGHNCTWQALIAAVAMKTLSRQACFLMEMNNTGHLSPPDNVHARLSLHAIDAETFKNLRIAMLLMSQLSRLLNKLWR